MTIRIGMGAGLGLVLDAPDYWRWVDLCEESGIDSIWHSDMLLGAMPEPLVLLSALAARTRRMRFGTNALVLSQRDPLVTAKQLASIAYLGGGRIVPVFGVGNAGDPFWAATGADPAQRGASGNEALRLIRLLLAGGDVSFAGAHFRYEGPGVQPRLTGPMPLWIGGHSAAAVRRTAALGDGWLGGLIGPDAAAAMKRRILAAAAAEGRAIDDDHYGTSVAFRFGRPDDPQVAAFRHQFAARARGNAPDDFDQAIAAGGADEIVACFQAFVAAGISKFVAFPIAVDADDLCVQTERLAREVLPRVEDRAG